MEPKFQRIILYTRQYRSNPEVNVTLQKLVDFLKTQNIMLYIDQETFADFAVNVSDFELSILNLPILAYEEFGKQRDLMIVVGGDGSLLSAARMAINVNVPVVGINRGRLGFLTDILPKELEYTLSQILNGDYHEEHRCLLSIQINSHNIEDISFQGVALNDVVLNRGNSTHLVEFEMYINKQYVCNYSADGLIISTPTGSTAYALSAGGPIMHPQINAFIIVPMCSHSLNSRPLVVDANSYIDLIISKNNAHELGLSCDGHESRMVNPGQQVSIQKNLQYLRLLHPKNYNYYETLRSKLSWQFKTRANMVLSQKSL